MKKTMLRLTPLLPAIGLALAQTAAASPTWSDPAGGNWSVSTNWSTGAVPGATNDVIFGNIGAGQPNTDDITGETIDSLFYNQDNGGQQTTVISPGKTLTVNSSVAAGSALLYVGSTTAATTSTTLVPVIISGAGSTLSLNGPGDIWVAQGNGTASSHAATLDLSGLTTFNANVGRLLVGVNINGINRPTGVLLLAQTNIITCTGASPQVEVQEATVNANGGTVSSIAFGQFTQLNADTMRFGGDKGNGTVNFGSFGSSFLQIRNADGISPCTVIDFGYNDFVSSGNSTVATADFTAGTVDISANLMHIAQGNPGTGAGSCTGTLGISAGVLNVADLEIGYGNAAAANSGGTSGTLIVNGTPGSTNGATVISSTVINLARTNGPVSPITGTLTVNGGTIIANAITGGGGNSQIGLNTGTLTVSNTVGSLAQPIKGFSVGGATINIPLSNAGAAITVSNLLTGGPTLVNITAVPGIATYPATFTLIQYQGAVSGAGTGTFQLGSFPAASPAFVGTIVDTGNGVVQVTLSHGPTATLNTTWTGATDNNWDLSTQNWLYQGAPAAFINGRTAIFTDTTSQTNIQLDGAIAPGQISVTDTAKQYIFGGTGFISGAALLTKSGTSSLTLDNSGGNNGVNSVLISAGTLQIGEGDTNGGLASVNITNNGALVFERTDIVNLNSTISGSGTLTQGGSGTVILSGANSYNGATSVTNGTLEIDQTTTGTGPVTTSVGTVLSGFGVVGGPVTVHGTLSPGSATLPGNFQAQAGLTLAAGANLSFGLNASDTSTADNANDSVAVTGNLTVNNNPISVTFAGAPQGGTYTLFTYSGNLSGSFNPVVTGTHFQTSLDTSSSPGSVLLNVTGNSGLALKWNSTSDSTWDNGTTNWLNLANSTASTFAAGDSVLLDDTAGVQTTLNINAGVTVYPSSITNSASNNVFTISGAGGIGGSTGIVKTGTTFLLLDTANSFTGNVDIQGGTLVTQNGAALGNSTSVTAENGATLDVDGQNLGAITVTASGSGVGGQGAIINSGAAQVQVFRALVLAGDTTIGGSGNMEINNSGGAASLSTGGQPFNLTKSGTFVLDLQNVATFDTNLADIDIQGGTILFDGLTPGMGDPTHTLTVETGASLAFGADTVTWNKVFVFNGDGSTLTLNNEGSANCILGGPVTLNGPVVFNIGGTQLGITGGIGGTGGLVKSGASLLILSGTNSYVGDTVVNTGTLELTNGANLSTSANITLAAGTILDTEGVGVTLASGHTLNGNGTVINGSLVAGAGSTVSPGVSDATGRLSVSGAISLAGTTAMDLDPSSSTNDVLSSTSTITYGGTLSLNGLSLLSAGNSFKLFSAANASSYLGNFASLSPATPGAGLAWDTSALKTTGTLKIVSSSGPAQPRLTSVSISGTTLNIHATNGADGGRFVLLSTTNLTTPLSQWTHVLTNNFDGNGNLNLSTNIISHSVSNEFFIISQ